MKYKITTRKPLTKKEGEAVADTRTGKMSGMQQTARKSSRTSTNKVPKM